MTSQKPATDVMIRLEALTKRYPGQQTNAVDSLDLDIHTGEIVVLVGPSGCGKTTTMKMINRIIEPTSGRIVLGGEDVTTTNPDLLRRRIGYVIQQIGLFPHMTIGENIATVPKLLGWDKRRIAARVDELLELVGMPPADFRDRYPNQLSGGQQQRIGVARALGGDPEVMLMDEPFGAIDPLTRDRLQNELLRLQDEVHKTIVFVTHDIDEAIKLGDQVVVMRVGGTIAQLASPADLLADPTDDFVADFLGRDRGYRGLAFQAAPALPVSVEPTVELGTSVEVARRVASGAQWLLVVDEAQAPVGWVEPDRLVGPVGREVLHRGGTVAPVNGSLRAALDAALSAPSRRGVLVDSEGRLVGTVLAREVLTEIEREPGGDQA